MSKTTSSRNTVRRRLLAFDSLGSRLLPAAGLAGVREVVAVERNVVYRDMAGDRQQLDIYRPAGASPEGGHAVLVAIHGGGWARFDKRGYGREVARFTRLGFVVIAPNYRLSRPEQPSWPTNLDDLREAIRWIRRNAVTLDVNPNQIAAIGESAGGHLAELLGTTSDESLMTSGEPKVSSRVDAVVSYYGPSDLAALARRSPAAGFRARQLLGMTATQAPELYRSASPIDQVSPDDAPMFLVHGSADTLVPVSQSIAMARKLGSEGVAARLVVIPGAPHGFALDAGDRRLTRAISRFLRSWMN